MCEYKVILSGTDKCDCILKLLQVPTYSSWQMKLLNSVVFSCHVPSKVKQRLMLELHHVFVATCLGNDENLPSVVDCCCLMLGYSNYDPVVFLIISLL